jgi:repressor LexA
LSGPQQRPHHRVPDYFFQGLADDHYVLRVSGESMIEEGIHDGDFVIVLRREHAAQERWCSRRCTVHNEATLKHFFPETERVRL